jgi:hypothetical protein
MCTTIHQEIENCVPLLSGGDIPGSTGTLCIRIKARPHSHPNSFFGLEGPDAQEVSGYIEASSTSLCINPSTYDYDEAHRMMKLKESGGILVKMTLSYYILLA